ncbi:MAG TPA: hypothetical protein VF626_00785 [Chthoniobacterales bacterium]|jgi:hypothetical protein
MKTLRFPALLAIAVFLASCAGPEGAPPTNRSTVAPERAAATQYSQPPQDRPGLGTKWGETRISRVASAAFDRASKRPLAIAAIHYNNAAGIRAMAGAVEGRRAWPQLRGPAGSLVSVGLRDESGKFLPGLIIGDRWFVVGEEGRRYSIVVRNRSALRLEVVLSVDGLDVIDGRPASFGKRGYLIDSHRQLVVEGFRQSTEAVAAFRFGPVRESYAQQKYGDSRNVGVIGVAIFNERGTNPWTDREVEKRLKADPFPSRFATPP